MKVNKEQYDVFERMHWLCFHLEFEHGDYDPDEACDDSGCPWSLIQNLQRQSAPSRKPIELVRLQKQEIDLLEALVGAQLVAVETSVADYEESRGLGGVQA